MPDYLAPGISLEETSFRPKPIEGVSTSTTGFVGPTRYGPTDAGTEILTSLSEFERIYGDGRRLTYRRTAMPNYMWHAARAFFAEGGKRLAIARVFKPLAGTYPPADFSRPAQSTAGLYDDGHARASLPSEGGEQALSLRARFPGTAGNLRVRFTIRLGPNILGGTTQAPTIGALSNHDVVWIGAEPSPVVAPPGAASLYLAEFDTTEGTWRFKSSTTPTPADLRLQHADPKLSLDPALGIHVRVMTVTVTVQQNDGMRLVWQDLPPDPHHQRTSEPDSLSAQFADERRLREDPQIVPLIITLGSGITDGLAIVQALIEAKPALGSAVNCPRSSDAQRSVTVKLTGGNDGRRPTADEYRGAQDAASDTNTGLVAFEAAEDLSIIAAPGSTFGLEDGYRADAEAIASALISQAERMRYRMAVLDCGNAQSLAQVRAMRAKWNSAYAALYYPWVRVLDPLTHTEILLPPSGFVAGIYARTDSQRGVWKAPANEVLTLAIGFEQSLDKSQQEVLNPEGINCFRFFEGRGFRLWGARTMSSDPEWRYVNLRRYVSYLERSIETGTQWAVFEPNDLPLWNAVRRTIEGFLFNEWKNGALLGAKPEEAYFVTCDRSTMTQNDLDAGRLICLVGVAPLRPAEFLIFRIGQWTADHQG